MHSQFLILWKSFFLLNNCLLDKNTDVLNFKFEFLNINGNKEIKITNTKKCFFKKQLRHKQIFVDIKMKNKNKFIRKKNLNSIKIVNNSKSFKKKYR